MKKFVLGLSLLTSLSAFSAELATTIVEVGAIESGEKEVMVFAQAEGRVLWVDASDTSLLEALKTAKEKNLLVNINFRDFSGKIRGVELLETAMPEINSGESFEKNALANFQPSLIDSVAISQSVFNRLDGSTKWRSQCYNRAHGWAYDMWAHSRVSSMKVFIFFTQRYIKAEKYKWWFHVAPYVLTNMEGASVETVLDRTFTRGPLKMKDWSDNFMKSKQNCPVVTRYTEYRNNQFSQDCYLIKTNMYYVSPRDIERNETEGRHLTDWDLQAVARARKQAFKNWRDYNP